jgi:predicted ATP-binding protein involved in virulence
MKMDSLSLTNYRGAHLLRLDFHPRLNIFFGENGAGKSTILDATAVMLSWIVSRTKHAGTSGRPIVETDITNGKSFSSVEIVCSNGNDKVSWRLSKTKQGHAATDDRSFLIQLNEFTKQIQSQISATTERVNLPLFVHYPVNRAVLDIPLRIRKRHHFSLLSAYDESLTSGANFRTFFEWFREREDLENENRKYVDSRSKPDGFVFPDPQLDAVRNALKQFLPEFGNLVVRRDTPLRMELEKNEERLTVGQLSDGEKCLIAMIGDLTRRLAIANPTRKHSLDGEGIILIDEIDLHLHPRWQRMIVPRLLKVFPNCQFIISTHSPHVITHVRPENLYDLRQTPVGITAERPSESYGKNVDRILEDLMGLDTTRPDEVTAELRTIYEEIDRSKLESARQKIAEMKLNIGADPDLAKAEVLIKRKEMTGK